jgi:hypothetical protein
MSRRMNRARDLLRQRLPRRGLGLSSGLLFLLIAKEAGPVAVSRTLASLTTQAALAFGAGQAALKATVSGQVASLAEEILTTSTLATTAKTGSLLITLVLLAVIGTTGGMLTHQIWTLLHGGVGWCASPAKAAQRK